MLSIVLCLCLSLASVLPVTRARAADEIKYSRVESESVTLYMDSSLTIPWFTLPYGYFVKVVNVLGSCAKVEYKGDSACKRTSVIALPESDAHGKPHYAFVSRRGFFDNRNRYAKQHRRLLRNDNPQRRKSIYIRLYFGFVGRQIRRLRVR